MAAKEQERKVLEQIRKLVDELGQDSYIAMAFEGCFEVAEENIENDFGCSMQQKVESARNNAAEAKKMANDYMAEYEKAVKEIARLKNVIEAEQEWKPYTDTDNVEQKDYDKLVQQSDTRFLSDDEVKDLLYDGYGFEKKKIVIHKSVPVYEVSRHHHLRKVGTAERRPAYNASDWNYIRFDCGEMSYELHDGSLRFFLQ